MSDSQKRCNALIDGISVGKHPLVACFISGARRLRSPVRIKDLAGVLEGPKSFRFTSTVLASDISQSNCSFAMGAITGGGRYKADYLT